MVRYWHWHWTVLVNCCICFLFTVWKWYCCSELYCFVCIFEFSESFFIYYVSHLFFFFHITESFESYESIYVFFQFIQLFCSVYIILLLKLYKLYIFDLHRRRDYLHIKDNQLVTYKLKNLPCWYRLMYRTRTLTFAT